MGARWGVGVLRVMQQQQQQQAPTPPTVPPWLGMQQGTVLPWLVLPVRQRSVGGVPQNPGLKQRQPWLS